MVTQRLIFTHKFYTLNCYTVDISLSEVTGTTSGDNRMSVRITTAGAKAELAINQFIKEFRTAQWDDATLTQKFKQLVKDHVEELEECSDMIYNASLARDIISSLDFGDLRSFGASNYVTRKYVKSVMKLYVQSVAKSRTIIAKDRTLFGLQMERYGINLGFTAESSASSLTPDGNVLTVMAGLLVIVALIIYKPQ